MMNKIIILFLFLIVSCTHKNVPEIILLQKNMDKSDTYYIKNYKNDERTIKYLFDNIKVKMNTTPIILVATNKNTVSFEDSLSYFKTNADWLCFIRDDSIHNMFNSITFNMSFNGVIIDDLVETAPHHYETIYHRPIELNKNTDKNQAVFSGDFENINFSIFITFRSYIHDIPKDSKEYHYILKNKNNEIKAEIIYYNYGKYFDVELY